MASNLLTVPGISISSKDFSSQPSSCEGFFLLRFSAEGKRQSLLYIFLFFFLFLFGVILFHKLKTFAEESEIWEKIQLICQIFQELRKME